MALAFGRPALAQTANIKVFSGGGVAISPLLYGVNYVWDKIPAGEFATYQAQMDGTAHATVSRYLGGWGAEYYDWTANTESGKRANVPPGEPPDSFLAAVQAASFITPSEQAIAHPDEIADDVRETVGLVARYGARVRYWEIGNEWWLQEGAAQNPDIRARNLRNYAALLAAAVPAMKAVNPSIQIFATGDWTQPQDLATLAQLTGPAWAQIDGISIHTYCGATDPLRHCTALPAGMEAVRAATGKRLLYASEWAATRDRNPDDFGIRNANLTILALQDMVFAGIEMGAYWPPVKIIPALAFASPDEQTSYATGVAFGWMSKYYEGTALRTAGDLPALVARNGGQVSIIVATGDAGPRDVRVILQGGMSDRPSSANVLYSEDPDDPVAGRPARVASLPVTISSIANQTVVQFKVNPGGVGRGNGFEVALVVLQQDTSTRD